jgi:hypothetical protein
VVSVAIVIVVVIIESNVKERGERETGSARYDEEMNGETFAVVGDGRDWGGQATATELLTDPPL